MSETGVEGVDSGFTSSSGPWNDPPTSKGLEAFLHRDWQNVQDNVKGAFFFLAAVMQEQAREINALVLRIDHPGIRWVSSSS